MKRNIKVSVITVVYNGEKTIAEAINSVLSQDYDNIEYIIVDGASKDGTMSIVNQFGNKISKVVSEPDKGLYDAMNKGLALATGDVIGILNADDLYANNQVVSAIVSTFEQNQELDAVSSDVAIYKEENFSRPWRYYAAKSFRLWQFRLGIQPPHPGFFVKRTVYEKYGNFDTQYRISADFDLLLRFLYIHKTKTKYIDLLSVKMRDGGLSSQGLKSKILMNKEDLHSLRKNGVWSFGLLIWSKYLIKVFQLLKNA